MTSWLFDDIISPLERKRTFRLKVAWIQATANYADELWWWMRELFNPNLSSSLQEKLVPNRNHRKATGDEIYIQVLTQTSFPELIPTAAEQSVCVCVFFLLCWVWVEVPPLCCYQYSHSPCDDLSPLSVHPFLIYYEYGGVSPWGALRRNYTPFNLTKTCRSICHTYQSSSSTRDRVCCLWGHRRVCKCVRACLYLLHT